MARRDIRLMLMGPPRKGLLDRHWVVVAAMALVLVAGVGLGVGIGMMASRKAPAPIVAGLERPVDDPAARRAPLMLPSSEDDGPAAIPEVEPSSPADHPAEAEPEIAPPEGRDLGLLTPPKGTELPAWRRFAVAAPHVAGRPMIAVVIDDMGLDKRRSERVTTLRAPLTLAYMTYAEDIDRQTAQAHAHGHELMVHMPMQPMSNSFDAGPEALDVGLPVDELRRRIGWGLSRFQGFVGVNNHMGSRFTADPAGMRVVMEELNRRGLLFLDSVTTEKSVAGAAAKRQGVPFATRQIFLDNEQSVHAVRAQLEKLEALSRKYGAAIAIGHPHDATIEALTAWLPTVESRGFALVPLTAVVRANASR